MQPTPEVPINPINSPTLDFDTIAYGSSHIDTLCKDLQINQDQLEEFLGRSSNSPHPHPEKKTPILPSSPSNPSPPPRTPITN